METLFTIKVSVALCLFVFFLMILFCLAWLVVEIGKRNTFRAKEYENLYKRIKSQIDNNIICENRYCFILKQIDRLQKLKYKNPEMTEVLKGEFYKKYKKISDEILSQDEFESKTIFGK